MSAREEMEHLRRENEALSQELRVTKQEAFRLSMLMEVSNLTLCHHQTETCTILRVWLMTLL